MNYNNLSFKAVSNSENGDVSSEMVFRYEQEGNVVTCTYTGENILKGHLIGLVDAAGCIQMRYHQVNRKGELLTGVCASKPERMPNGKVRLHESWKWTSGDLSSGTSILEEV